MAAPHAAGFMLRIGGTREALTKSLMRMQKHGYSTLVKNNQYVYGDREFGRFLRFR